ncbi:unnamed protein product [Adineta ricciae]|uniref:Uncharacterized protein n=1 Tax=Adineta ricciae TaxID=249248 RepID=A0A814Z5C0_ADIRI|nr:unnamed protein product [Adineta ricciae]CAF1238189.1 unnamed protein product [Adineta ricciae]
MSTTLKSNESLIVIVAGGGPVGLTFSLHLAMMMGKQAQIIVYEGRWCVDKYGKTTWQDKEQGKQRRDQVVTLQDHVIEQMPKYVQDGLFKNINERVWPTSRNIPIREVEDRLFDLIQPFVQSGQVKLVPENLDEQSKCLIDGDFDILVGADGSNSFVRNYCNIKMISEGVEYACGVAYDILDKVPPSEEPLHQALNCILTVSQTRYLVNSSTSRRGYLNIRLIQDEYSELRQCLNDFQTRNESLDLSDFNKCPQSPVWNIIRQGLEFFKIPSKYVFRVVPIEINVRHASIVVRELRFEVKDSEQATTATTDIDEKKYKTALAFLVGDAAMSVHFWPGRGMNSGMKGAIALARNILRTCTTQNAINIRKPLRFLDFLDYEGFMARLRAREQQGRSLRVLINPIDQYIEASYSYSHMSHCYVKYKNKLIAKLQEARERLQERSDWPHKSSPITDDQLQSASNRVAPQAVAQLSLANPWPTREMSGAEVLVEHTFPYDVRNFLPIPKVNFTASLEQTPSIILRYRFLILWIVGHEKLEQIDTLVRDIQTSPNYSKASIDANDNHQLAVVRNIDEAVAWMKANREDIRKKETLFKVVTVWQIKANETAVDTIRAVRSESSRVPVLIFTGKHETAQAALEFPNVMTSDTEYELKEFVGVKQEAQWNPGCHVKQLQKLEASSLTTKYGSEANDQTKFSSTPYPILDNIGSMPPLPNDLLSLRSTSISTPKIIWIDVQENNTRVVEEIRKNIPSVEIEFCRTFEDAKTLITQQERQMESRSKFIVICRGYFPNEQKGFKDVAQMLENLELQAVPMGVYTSNREYLLQRTPDPPSRVEIFDRPRELLAFVYQHLKK